MQEASVSLAAQRCRWLATDAMNEHLLYLRGPAGDIHDGPIAIPGGEAISLVEPLVFADREHQFRFIASGNVQLPDSEAIVAIGDDAQIQVKEGRIAELIGRVELASNSFRLFRLKSDALVRQSDDEWHVKLGQSTKLASSYVLEGQRLPFNTRPWPIFKGMHGSFATATRGHAPLSHLRARNCVWLARTARSIQMQPVACSISS